MKRSHHFYTILVLLVSLFPCADSFGQTNEKDTDKDGLSDFHEINKYLTNPAVADSDGDGIPDGDWKERREYQYTIRSVVQVMKPVTPEFLNDDYQDVRVLDETETYFELEVFHYPFNKVASTIKADENWRQTVGGNVELQKWLQAGPTSNWTPKLQKQILTEMKKDGIDVEAMNDMTTVQTASKWLLKRAKYQDGFSTFITAFDKDGKPYIPEELSNAADRKSQWTVEEQWEREILADGMFKHKLRGACSSSSIYLSGCLRALDIPTRTVLCIPLIDANDDSELKMLNRIQEPGVRYRLSSSLKKLKGSWASHSFNEVYVGERWRRLNYDNLGQGIYDRNLFGLITHVATFHDWANAKMPETIGKRQKSERSDDVFGGPNPYSTISLRDEKGVHCQVKLPEFETQKLIVKSIQWTDAKELPEDIRNNCKAKGRFGLIAEVVGFKDRNDVPEFLEVADLRVHMKPKFEDDDPQRIRSTFDRGCYWLYEDNLKIYIPFGPSDKVHFKNNKPYEFVVENSVKCFQWKTDGLTIVRKGVEE